MSLAGRPSVRMDHVHGVGLFENPKWRRPKGEFVRCHDGSPMIDFGCPNCGGVNHVHETQLAEIPAAVDEIGMRCTSCRHPMVVSRRFLERGFRDVVELGG